MDDDDDLDQFEPIRKAWPGGTMPVGSEGARRRGRLQTAKGRKAKKRVGQNTTGIRRRRNKKGFGDGC